MAITRKESTPQKDNEKESSLKDLSRESVSYQDQRESTSKMGPVSSTVEGSK